MRNINERPVCHRAEDLVTYLYSEASEADARDFASHLQQCDACRAEFGVFNQVHDSILLWRNEALGSAFNPAAVLTDGAVNATQFVQHERKLSALAALREFFNVSPLWLRGATAFAALLLCVLGLLAISRSWNKPVEVASSASEQKRYTESDMKNEVAKQIEKQISDLKRSQSQPPVNVAVGDMQVKPSPQQNTSRRQLAGNSASSGSQRTRGLSRAEREQLAADLRLIPGRDEDEPPFGLSDEPNQ
jgi:hypothetical protein